MKYVLATLLSIPFLFVSLPAQSEPTYTISGTVKDINGAVIAGAQVRLLTAARHQVTTLTDRDGKFEFRDCTARQYILIANSTGFGVASKAVNLTADSFFELVLEVGEQRFTVTAEIGQTEDVNRIPQPVNIMGDDAIRERVTSFTAQIAREEVGLNVQRTSPTIGAIVVRGLTGKNVVNFVDGVRYTNGAQRGGINTFFNLNDASNLDTVEVLRGPNSAQYGSDSLGGTVNLLTRSVEFGSDIAEWRGEFNAGYNSADRSFGSSVMFGYGTR